MQDDTIRQAEKPSTWCIIRTWLWRLFLVGLTFFAGFLLIVILGLIPVNNDFDPEAGEIEIRLISNAVHADMLLPMSNDVIDWRNEFPSDCFRGDTSHATHIAIGWGDRGFFLDTPRWADLKLSTAAKALFWPSESCMHVVMTDLNYGAQGGRQLLLTQQQYAQLVEFIRQSFRKDEAGEILQVPGFAYQSDDAFFEAQGSYNLLNTCNSWVGRGLKQCGVRVPWLTPLPKSVFLYLPPATE